MRVAERRDRNARDEIQKAVADRVDELLKELDQNVERYFSHFAETMDRGFAETQEILRKQIEHDRACADEQEKRLAKMRLTLTPPTSR